MLGNLLSSFGGNDVKSGNNSLCNNYGSACNGINRGCINHGTYCDGGTNYVYGNGSIPCGNLTS